MARPDSFTSQLRAMLALRQRCGLFRARQVAVPEFENPALLVLVHELPDGGGVQDIRQLWSRPLLRWPPYSTPLPGVYLCFSSTPPGGGVHGMCGFHAARAALGHAALWQ